MDRRSLMRASLSVVGGVVSGRHGRAQQPAPRRIGLLINGGPGPFTTRGAAPSRKTSPSSG